MSMMFNLAAFLARSSTETPYEETDLFKTLAKLPQCTPNGPWLAGGALRRTIQGQPLDSDIDFFFRDEDQKNKFVRDLQHVPLNDITKVRETPHHEHYRGITTSPDPSKPIDIQAIKFQYYANMSEVIDSFDFTICQFAFNGNNVVMGDYSLWDLGRKRLAINKITYPVSTMRRALKYGKQGFTVCNGALTEILRQTASNPELLNQLNVHYVD
jgi:hypothetical protein